MWLQMIGTRHLFHLLVSQPQLSITTPEINQCDSEEFAGGGESNSLRKAHLRSIRSGETLEVQAMSKLPRLDTTITFSDYDMEGCQHPHEDPLVIRAIVANKIVHRVLIDNGSSVDIIFASIFNKMGIGEAGTGECPLIGIFRGKGTSTWVNPAGTHLRKSPMSGYNSGKLSYSRCSLSVQYVTCQAITQCFKRRPLCL